jgi:hypothetical protein
VRRWPAVALIAALFVGIDASMALAAAADAAALGPDDFARGRTLQPASADALQRLPLPADVYQWTARADLGDLRVFDGTGAPVPHAVRAPLQQNGYSPWRRVPVFPLPPPAEDGQPAKVDIRVGDSGAVVAVHGAASAAAATRAAYLIDSSGVDEPFSQLNLHWPPDQPDFVARVRLEASEDLDRWRVLAASATVAQLGAGGERIGASLLQFPGAKPRYLRLSQLDGAAPLLISSIEVRSQASEPAPREWQTLTGVPDGAGFRFESDGHFPVDLVRVGLAQASYLVEARVYSRAEPGHPWRLRGQQRFYRVAVPGSADAERPAAVQSDALEVAGHPPQRHWRIEWVTPEPAMPALEVGWRPHDLLFLQQGSPPFRLVYGRADTEPGNWPIDELAARLGGGSTVAALPAATAGEVEILGGPASLQRTTRFDWTTGFLWAVLIAGVALVAGLAHRLIRAA